MNKKLARVLAVTLGTAIGASTLSVVAAGCTPGTKDSVVLMTEAVSGLFNPFYATSGTDQDVIGMTQIGMLTTDENGKTACGEDEATVVLDYKIEQNGENSVYTFVLKNDLKFSDGYALTMNDVLFNMYEYLDPVYTGSSTMYSVKIEGLTSYRLQQNTSEGDETSITNQAAALAKGRVQELLDVYSDANDYYNPNLNSPNVNEAQMRAYITSADYVPTNNYRNAVGKNPDGESTDAYYRGLVLEDYEHILNLFKKELQTDFETAKDAYDLGNDPYKKWADDQHFKNDVFKFFYYEGLITPKYAKGSDNKDDKTNIESFDNMNLATTHNTQEKAINYVYTFYVYQKFDAILSSWGTANTLTTEFQAKAREVLLQSRVEDGLEIPNISGIVSLGHTSNISSVTIGQKSYTVAHSYDTNWTNADGSINKNYGAVTNDNEYAVLQITVEGTDPKAIYNFGFTVAPAHYYTADSKNPNGRKIDIANNEFGVEWANYDFQSKTIQSDLHVGVPVGAGPFVATDSANNDNPSATGFWNSNIIYYKKNENFSCLGEQFEVQAEKLRFQVVSSNNALDSLASGAIDYATPQLTPTNNTRLDGMKSQGFESMAGWQLGYGYIGINAGKVPNVYVRRAIMSAMNTELALDYYKRGTCDTIAWPMSKVSWAYPSTEENGHAYTAWEETTRDYSVTKEKIEGYLREARTDPSIPFVESMLTLKFTIAGASITEHPTYPVFKQAATILNQCGFTVEVVADSQALTKLATGSLAVWAAAWGSTIDPDMYQVYSPYSTATSVKAWGYPQILADTTTYSYEYDILTRQGGLSDLIDEARTITEETRRKALYQEAMGLILDLAVEMPVYQRQTLYAYNANNVTGFSDCIVTDPNSPNYGLVNPYSSPLGEIWKIALKK